MADSTISKQDAISFTTDVLGLFDVERKYQDNKYELLCEIVRSFHEKVPFQTLTLISLPMAERRKPTLPETLSAIQSCKGGLCYSLNVFMKLLLDALGYSASHVLGNVTLPDNHIITVVTFEDCKYLIEVGCGFPTFQPIPLNFDQESPIYDESFIKYRFKRTSNGEIERQHLFRAPDATWKRFYSFTAAPKTFSEIEEPMTYAYKTREAMLPLHNHLRAIKFVNQKVVCFLDMTLLREDESGALQETKFTSEAEFLDAVKTHFPLLVEDAKKALTHWEPTDNVDAANVDEH